MQKKMRKTKIVCTIGPASWDAKTVKLMYLAGMNVARINGAFADVEELSRVEKLIRNVSPNIALMLDIKGHEVRLNKFTQAVLVKKGDEIIIGNTPEDEIYPATFPELWKDLKPGQKIMVDKGATGLEITKITSSGKIHAKILFGEKVAPGKGMNFPGAKLSNEAITDIDKKQIKYCAEAGWEFVSASFIRNKNDVAEVRKAFGENKIHLIAKIEDQQGVENIDEIISESDGIMIARGDLGSEMPLEKLPMIQKQLIYKSNHAAKPVILATNLLESMTVNIFPTRAEVTDVANGVLEGTDALMTSGETAQGKHPVESVEMLDRLAVETEQYLDPIYINGDLHTKEDLSLFPSQAVFEASLDPKVDKIIVLSNTGIEPRILARFNIAQPIFAFVNDDITRNQLNLTKCVQAVVFRPKRDTHDEIIVEIVKFAINQKFVLPTDRIVITGKTTSKTVASPYIYEVIDINKFIK